MKQTITKNRAKAMFHQTFKGQGNFMTPNFENMYTAGNLAIELSSGEGMEKKPIKTFADLWAPGLFGVTVLRDGPQGIERESGLSGSFNTKIEALEYITELTEQETK